ncbi:MAG: inorganic phosphate transporter, partial [Thermoprotei archaeon]
MDASFMILVLGFLASFYMAWNIGANDAANPTDTAVGSGALSLEKALLIFSVSALIGALTQGWMVMKTLGKGIVTDIEVVGALCAVLGAGIWVLAASLKGMPISTSQSITGGVLGIGLAYVALEKMSIQEINWEVVINILLSWITSPALSIVLA